MTNQKMIGYFDVLIILFKKSILCAEGTKWKHTRKTLSQVFNFDFIVSQIPTMTKVADQVFDEF